MDTVDEEVAITWNAADWVAEEREMHDLWYADQGLDVAPVADIVVVQIEELQLAESCEDFGRRQTGD